jgi:hypothetical protein
LRCSCSARAAVGHSTRTLAKRRRQARKGGVQWLKGSDSVTTTLGQLRSILHLCTALFRPKIALVSGQHGPTLPSQTTPTLSLLLLPSLISLRLSFARSQALSTPRRSALLLTSSRPSYTTSRFFPRLRRLIFANGLRFSSPSSCRGRWRHRVNVGQSLRFWRPDPGRWLAQNAIQRLAPK